MIERVPGCPHGDPTHQRRAVISAPVAVTLSESPLNNDDDDEENDNCDYDDEDEDEDEEFDEDDELCTPPSSEYDAGCFRFSGLITIMQLATYLQLSLYNSCYRPCYL